jgi:hypothetical protein
MSAMLLGGVSMIGIKADTIKLRIPTRIIKHSNQNPKDTMLGLRYADDKNFYKSDFKHETWICSSKILKSEYSEGITKYNLSKLVVAINGSGILEVDANHFIDNVQVCAIDFASDVKRDDWDRLRNALSTCVLSNSYRIDPYDKNDIRESVVFTKKGRVKESFTLYDKYVELQDVKNDDIRPFLDIEDFKDVSRIEARYRTIAEIRDTYGFPTVNHYPYLRQILESDINPLRARFRNIIDFDMYKNRVDTADLKSYSQLIPSNNFKTPQEENEFYKYLYWHNFFEGDYAKILNYIKNNSKPTSFYDNKNKYRKKYLPLIQDTTKYDIRKNINDFITILGG